MLEAKRRAAIFFILAFILAAATGYMVLQKVKDLNSDLGAMTKIYVAKADIPSRTVIQKNQITVMELPNKFVTESHITSFGDLESQVSVVPLSKGDMITRNMIKPASNLQNENNRLVTLHRTDKVQFDQVIEALDRVDIIVSTENKGERKTSVFMKDVVVRFSQGSGEKFAGVAVEVTAEQAPKLIHMQNYADHIRILKANVGQNSVPSEETEEKEARQEEPAKKKVEEKPATTPPKENATKKETPKEGPTSGSGQ
ncbi:Flp pilus assembly protein CpaB [Paenisporosarcina sp. OV554]|uniref:Flp pilus assembly protein CpaB n=1 Tax=Paenisporosarcina sp. OV554 TaxID=2135694 RepID=UPI000D36D7CA|nr:SAF domain-containing protein [Paenisporosarcina sp. OV554]PUB16766.1 pilus assembly protein CpaB [Paenisporosarcina sp. OV554]